MITEGHNKQLKYPSIWTYEEYQDIINPNPDKLYWHVEEKIDGMNICIEYEDGVLSYFGREKSELEPKYLEFLKKLIFVGDLNKVMPLAKNYALYGELYGLDIYGLDIGANSKHYETDLQFALFDVYIQSDTPTGFIWLSRDNVKDIAQKLNLKTPTEFGTFRFKYVKQLLSNMYDTKAGFLTKLAGSFIEGLVLRTEPLLLNRKHERIMLKLKKEDLEWIKKLNL